MEESEAPEFAEGDDSLPFAGGDDALPFAGDDDGPPDPRPKERPSIDVNRPEPELDQSLLKRSEIQDLGFDKRWSERPQAERDRLKVLKGEDFVARLGWGEEFLYQKFGTAAAQQLGHKVGRQTLANWIKGLVIKQGWVPDDPIPHIRQVETSMAENGILVYRGYSFENAMAMAVKDGHREGDQFYWERLSGTRELKKISYGSKARQFNFKHAPYSKELLDILYRISAAHEAYLAAVESGQNDEYFVRLILETQFVLYADQPWAANGMFDQDTAVAVADWESRTQGDPVKEAQERIYTAYLQLIHNNQLKTDAFQKDPDYWEAKNEVMEVKYERPYYEQNPDMPSSTVARQGNAVYQYMWHPTAESINWADQEFQGKYDVREPLFEETNIMAEVGELPHLPDFNITEDMLLEDESFDQFKMRIMREVVKKIELEQESAWEQGVKPFFDQAPSSTEEMAYAHFLQQEQTIIASAIQFGWMDVGVLVKKEQMDQLQAQQAAPSADITPVASASETDQTETNQQQAEVVQNSVESGILAAGMGPIDEMTYRHTQLMADFLVARDTFRKYRDGEPSTELRDATRDGFVPLANTLADLIDRANEDMWGAGRYNKFKVPKGGALMHNRYMDDPELDEETNQVKRYSHSYLIEFGDQDAGDFRTVASDLTAVGWKHITGPSTFYQAALFHMSKYMRWTAMHKQYKTVEDLWAGVDRIGLATNAIESASYHSNQWVTPIQAYWISQDAYHARGANLDLMAGGGATGLVPFPMSLVKKGKDEYELKVHAFPGGDTLTGETREEVWGYFDENGYLPQGWLYYREPKWDGSPPDKSSPVLRRPTKPRDETVADELGWLSLGLTIAALALSPFTGGASLVLLYPAAALGVASSAINIHDAMKRGKLDSRTVLTEGFNIAASLIPLLRGVKAFSAATRITQNATKGLGKFLNNKLVLQVEAGLGFADFAVQSVVMTQDIFDNLRTISALEAKNEVSSEEADGLRRQIILFGLAMGAIGAYGARSDLQTVKNPALGQTDFDGMRRTHSSDASPTENLDLRSPAEASTSGPTPPQGQRSGAAAQGPATHPSMNQADASGAGMRQADSDGVRIPNLEGDASSVRYAPTDAGPVRGIEQEMAVGPMGRERSKVYLANYRALREKLGYGNVKAYFSADELRNLERILARADDAELSRLNSLVTSDELIDALMAYKPLLGGSRMPTRGPGRVPGPDGRQGSAGREMEVVEIPQAPTSQQVARGFEEPQPIRQEDTRGLDSESDGLQEAQALELETVEANQHAELELQGANQDGLDLTDSPTNSVDDLVETNTTNLETTQTTPESPTLDPAPTTTTTRRSPGSPGRDPVDGPGTDPVNHGEIEQPGRGNGDEGSNTLHEDLDGDLGRNPLDEPTRRHSYQEDGIEVELDGISVEEFRDFISQLSPAMRQRLRNMSPSDVAKFMKAWYVDGRIHPGLIGNEGLIDSWTLLGELGLADRLRNKISNLEIAQKMAVPYFTKDTARNNKKMLQVIEGLDQIGEKGEYVASMIKSGKFENNTGFKKLIGSVKRSGNPPPHFRAHPGWAVAQAIRRAEMDTDVPKSQKVFEDVTGDYDIDYGVLSENGSHKYDVAYQFKSVGEPANVKDAISGKTIKRQLLNADAGSKIFEVEMRSGTIDDLNIHSQAIEASAAYAKSIVPGLIINVTDTTGRILRSF